MAYTDVWDVTSPLDTQAANQGATDFRATKLDIMQRVASFGAGLLAARPTPETTSGTADWTGVMYWATDTQQVFRWSGTAWVDISAFIPSSGGTNFSDVTQPSITNPSAFDVLNTITIPASFTTGGVVRIRTLISANPSVGTPVIRLVANGSNAGDFGLAAGAGGNTLLLDIELLAISTIAFQLTAFVINQGSVVIIDTTSEALVYAAGTPFTFVTEVRDAFTGTINTSGLSGFII